MPRLSAAAAAAIRHSDRTQLVLDMRPHSDLLQRLRLWLAGLHEPSMTVAAMAAPCGQCATSGKGGEVRRPTAAAAATPPAAPDDLPAQNDPRAPFPKPLGSAGGPCH